MHWFLIALAAPFLWALVNVADKYLVVNYGGGGGQHRSSGSLVLFSSLIGIFVALAIGLFVPEIFSIALTDKLLLILVGGLSICWIILYLFALEIEDVSTVVPWMLTIPVFGYLFGYLFLNEVLTYTQILGMGIIFLGAVVLSVDVRTIKISFKREVVFYMLLVSIIYAANGILFKLVASERGFWVSSFWEHVGLGGAGLIIFALIPRYRQDFLSMLREDGATIFGINVMSELCTIAGNLLTNYALLLAPVALVYMVSTFQPVAVLIFTLITSMVWPQIVKEDFSPRIVTPKLIAVACMVLGSAIMFL